MTDRQLPDRRSVSDTNREALRWEIGSIPVESMIQRTSDHAGFELVVWVEAVTRRVLAARFIRPTQRPHVVAELLSEAMFTPRQGEPRRPAELRSRDPSIVDALRSCAEPLGIRVTLTDRLAEWDSLVGEFGAFLAAHWPGRSYLTGRGVTPRSVGFLFEAAAAFYAAAPWRELPEVPIELHLTERRQPFFLVVLGHERPVQGLALHLTRASAERSMGESTHPGYVGDAIALTFEREDSVPPPMRDEWRKHRWPLAGPAAFPLPYRRLRSGTMREPSAPDLAYMTLALQAIAELGKRAGGVNVTERRVETVQLHGAMGDSIARLVIPASFVSTDAPDGGSSPRAG
jgi:hypothetical protein